MDSYGTPADRPTHVPLPPSPIIQEVAHHRHRFPVVKHTQGNEMPSLIEKRPTLHRHPADRITPLQLHYQLPPPPSRYI